MVNIKKAYRATYHRIIDEVIHDKRTKTNSKLRESLYEGLNDNLYMLFSEKSVY
jgi:hypothetical protein